MHIVLTGCSRGLGASLIPHFLAAGHTISGCARNPAKAKDLTSLDLSRFHFDTVDVADDAAVAAWSKLVLARGPVDLLINNAALMNNPQPLWTIPDADFDRLMRVNVCGVANVIRHLVPAMVARGAGVIVNLSSGWGRSTSPDVAPYCASKYAIEGLTLALAAELPRGMAAIPLNPGVIDTDMLRQAWADGASQYPAASEWAERAAPFLLQLGRKDNGRSLTVPGE
jgi:NAD(P)-dependent dehydrogenase (short-subunit alcohol dehydrogenase family)